MSKLGEKDGLATRQEIKFFVEFIMDNVEMKSIYKTGIKLVLPAVIDSIDNKLGDRLPEPWQTYAENLITSVYDALQDKVLTDEEIDGILENVANILGTEIKLPLLGEEDAIVAFEFLLKYLAMQVKILVTKKSE